MSGTSAPFGLRPAYHPSGTIRTKAGTIASGYAANIYKFAPVKIVAAGTLELAAAGDRAVGVFLGCEYKDSEGRPRVNNKWPTGQVATEIVAYYTDDPAIVYEIQSNAALALTGMGQQYDWSTNDTNAGNTTTGHSNVSLNIASAAANAGVRVIGINPGPDNAWGDTYVNALVQISEHQLVADVASV